MLGSLSTHLVWILVQGVVLGGEQEGDPKSRPMATNIVQLQEGRQILEEYNLRLRQAMLSIVQSSQGPKRRCPPSLVDGGEP
jgi:hypothetical protein